MKAAPERSTDVVVRVRPSRRSVLWTVVVYFVVAGILAWARWSAPISSSSLIEPRWQGATDSPFHGALWLLEEACWLVAFVAAMVGSATLFTRRRSRDAAFVFGAAGLSAVFLADDSWQLHKPVFPDWSGLPSGVVLALYAALGLVWLVVFRAEIRRTDVAVLVVALVCFAVWTMCKAMPSFEARNSLEIASKLAGAAGWALYVTRTSLSLSRQRR